MLQLKIGVALATLRLPLSRALALAAEFKADAVEIDALRGLRPEELSQTALRELRKMLDDHRLRVCAVSFFTRHGYGDIEQLDLRVVRTKEVMQMAQRLGASVVVNHLGPIPAEREGSQWNLLLEVLADLGRHGHRVGAMLAAQTGASSGQDLARLISALPDGSLGVDLDPGQLIANGHSPLEAVELLGPHIMDMHATDAVRDAARGQSFEVPLGRGSADYPALFGAFGRARLPRLFHSSPRPGRKHCRRNRPSHTIFAELIAASEKYRRESDHPKPHHRKP